MSIQDRRFSSDEVTNIVRRALEGQRDRDEVPYDELAEIAAQFNISPGQLARAVEEEATLGAVERAKEAWHAAQRAEFREHLLAYIIVNGGLIVMNLMTTDYPWAMWVVVCWGIGLAIDAADTYFPNPKRVERGARKLLERERKLRERERKLREQRAFARI